LFSDDLNYNVTVTVNLYNYLYYTTAIVHRYD